DIIDVMQRIAGTVTTAGMSYKEAAALGSTFLSLGSSAEVAASASQAMIRELSIANMQSKRFRDGAKMLNLDLKQLQKSASIDPTGTIIRVMEAINKLPNEKRIEAATRLFGKEYGDDASKLASNLDEYRRQLALVNDERARGSMQREGDARNETLGAKQTMTGNAGTNVISSIGEIFAPEVKASLDWLKSMIQGFRDWAKENPGLSDGLATVFKVIAIGATVIGTITAAFGAVILPLAIMKASMVQLGLSGNPLIAGMGTVASKIWGVVSPVGKLVAAFGLGYAAGTLLNNGLDWMISKLAGYETSLGGFIFDVVQKFKAAPWSEIGGWIIKGIEAGLDSLTLGLYSKVKDLGAGIAKAAREALGIRSPSRVFAEIGNYTMQGLERGLQGGEDGPLSAIAATAKKLAAIGAGITLGASGGAFANETSAAESPANRPLPAVTAVAPTGNTYHITIQAPAGTDNQGLASLVAREIERIESSKAAQRRSRLRDTE
ncbi:MAG: phage tail tape measure protein, partial [Azonexus sp.]|nr:phage tail tape measure protein [Azonexus sp.]